ncbi:MAG: hypothetical protein OXF85_00380 [Candidatus Saccharibacteria bacterium]|nr:hypothetical protein [Candidatus Saccharibacteria bacterium]
MDQEIKKFGLEIVFRQYTSSKDSKTTKTMMSCEVEYPSLDKLIQDIQENKWIRAKDSPRGDFQVINIAQAQYVAGRLLSSVDTINPQ